MELWNLIMNKFECIVFDLDGTLIDSISHLFNIYKQFLKKYGYKGTSKEFNLLNGPKLNEVVGYLKQKYNLESPKSELLKYYNNEVEKTYRTKIILTRGVKKFLEFLKENNYKIGLVTSSNKKNTDAVLLKNDILDYFSFFVYGDDVSKSKPDPDIYKICIKRSNLNKNQIFVLEDSKNGYESAITAGLTCKKTTKFNIIQNWLSKNNISPNYKIITSDTCILNSKSSNHKISKNTKNKINQTWNLLQNNRTKKLSNNKVLSMKSIIKKNNVAYVKGEFIDYKTITSDRIDPSIKLNLYQIGISGMILFQNNKVGYTIFSVRNKNNTEYPNYLELIPSGNINKETLKDGKIDFNLHLIKEFVEETGLNSKYIKNISYLCLIKDKQNRVYDVCNSIELSVNKNMIMKHFRSSEYSKPLFIPISSLSKFIEQNHSKIVPTSLGMLDFFLKEKFILSN